MIATHATAEVATALSAVTSATGGGFTLLSFTPATAALGGLLLGIAAAGKLIATGRVLGVSGAIKGLVTADPAPWRVAFLMGLSLGALVLSGTLPGAFETIPESFPVWRAVLAGLLVGLGSSMGNGCTSGHGICGSARLSPRSFAYTASFMASGMATATLAGTAAALNVAPLPAALVMPAAAELQLTALVAVCGIAAFATLAAAARLLPKHSPAPANANALALVGQLGDLQIGGSGGAATTSGAHSMAWLSRCTIKVQNHQSALEMGAEVVAGVIFALGLGLSGMTRPSKVAGFLSVGAPMWDLSLPFVMGGAVMVALAAYQGVQRFRLMSKPLFCEHFQIPSSTVIDARLLVGGALFGAGWGLAGMCPGPALVAALQGDVHVLSYVAAMAAGMWLEGHIRAWAVQGPAYGRQLLAKRQLSM